MKKKQVMTIMLALAFTLVSCNGPLSSDQGEQATITETTLPQQTTEPAPAESTPSPEPTFQGQYESGAVEVLETDRDLVVAQCQSVTSDFDQRVNGAGWVQKTEIDVGFDNSENEYIHPMMQERWYLLDSDGYILDGYAWVSTLEDEVQQEIVYLNGWYDGVYRNQWYNLDYSFGPDGEIQDPAPLSTDPVRLTGGFCDRLTELDSPQVAVVDFAGVEALRFSFEDHYVNTYGQEGDLMGAMYFDRSTGTHLGTGTYEILPDGRLKAVSGTVDLQYAFNADPPEDRFAEIWARVPHGDTFVPVEQGEP